jgi:hypothetical protein
MPPRRFSRYTFSQGVLDDQERLLLTDREPFRFRDLPDNRLHVVAEGDSLFSLAAQLFASLDRPAGLWWIIADFQPEPIIDPTLELEVGRTLVVPSLRLVTEEIFNESRRGEAVL